MAEVVWTEPALADLDAIADYIAIENPIAASELVRRIFNRTEQQLEMHPKSGRYPPELGKRSRYKELIEPPCRIFYRVDASHVFIMHVMRSEQLLRAQRLYGEQSKI
ncbi:MAG: type II toxin-antitoxin system RelE/ParE family toxin [Pseudomonadota bacterium]|nr:type II toxin-antitoxin system RelE/ParE family toxin [Pseudomonadota bacterium]